MFLIKTIFIILRFTIYLGRQIANKGHTVE